MSDKRRIELRRIMRDNKLTAREVASLVDRSQSSVLHWMCGSRPVPKFALTILRAHAG